MNLRTRIALSLSLIGLSLIGSLSAAHPASAQSDVRGYVYVNDNTSVNAIAGFAQRSDGTLTPLSGSPFASGGTGKATASQGSLQTADGKYVLATNGGNNTISVLRIRENGALIPVLGSPFSSGGVNPNSIAVHDNLVYVSNYGDALTPANYTGFALSDAGHLTPIAGSTVTLTVGANPGDILFNATGTHLAATEVGTTPGTSFVDSFNVSPSGLLTSEDHFPAQGNGAFGSEFRPTNPDQLYVSNAHNGANLGTVSALSVNEDATLASIGASPYPDNQTAPCWVEISHNGRTLYAVNTAVPSISRYAVKSDGTLALIGSTPFNHPTGLAPVDLRLDPAGNFLYVVDTGAGSVSAFQVHDGNLQELPASPFALPTGAKPFGIVVVRASGDS